MPGEPWPDRMHEMLIDSETNDTNIIEFIEKSVPEDEGQVSDFKQKMFLSAEPDNTEKERKGELIKSICAFANTPHDSEYRYLIVGFSDSGDFVGISEWDQHNGDSIKDVDDSKIQNLINNSLSPRVKVERFLLNHNSETVCILQIKEEGQKPVMISNSIRKSSDKSIINSNTAYIRKGSSNRLMKNADYRKLIERREEVIDSIFQDIASDLSRVVSIPKRDLEDVELTATHEEGGIPVDQMITEDPVTSIDDKLTVGTQNLILQEN